MDACRSPTPDEAKLYSLFLGEYLGCTKNDMDCYYSKYHTPESAVM